MITVDTVKPMGRTLAVLVAASLLCGLLVWRFASPPALELARLRAENSRLERLLKVHEAPCPARPPSQSTVEAPPCRPVRRIEEEQADDEHAEAKRRGKSASGHTLGAEVTDERTRAADATHQRHLENDALLLAHRLWDWRSIVRDMLQPWPRIELSQLDAGVAACHNSSMYCSRLQVVDGRLYITDYRAIFFDRHYAPSRIMPILETLRRNPKMANLDIVVAANDEPRVPAIPGDRTSWTKTCTRWPGGRGSLPPAMFSSTVNRGVMDLPWVDFAWFFPRRPHKLRTPPWSVLHPQLVEAGGKAAWEGKIELAMHTGNVGSPFRKELVKVAAKSPDEMLVNELFIGDHAKIRQTCRELGLDKEGGYQQHKCYMKFEDQCRFKYLLNSASIGYANKFKSLLLCGSVVLYVRDGMRHKEFYEYGLVSGIHYVSVDKAEDVPAKVRWLRENDDYARAVAQAGRARMSSLDVGALTDFMAEVFAQYARRQAFQVRPQPGAVRIECEDDLWRHYALSRPWLDNYLMLDNATCVHPPAKGEKLGPPGWGGAYRGSKPRCTASHDLAEIAQPHACEYDKPYSTSESWEPFGSWPKPHERDPNHWDTR